MLIEQHASWLALNNVVGCPNNCVYCFLTSKASKPRIICEPKIAVESLFKSNIYKKETPICLMPNTDAFATPPNKEQLFSVCDELKKHNITNLVTVITKREITENDCSHISDLRNQGLNICVYVSYSGLEKNYEKGIRKNGQIEAVTSIKNLKKHNIPCIHYWRPLLPQNTNKKTLIKVLNTVKDYCIASCMTGLKLYNHMSCQNYWPEAQALFDKGINPECFVPKNSFDNIIELAAAANYSVFVDNVCILAGLQKMPCTYGLYKSERCNNYDMCSPEQREICGKYYNFKKPKTIQADTRCSLTDIFDIVKKQKVAIANQQLQKTQYWHSYFTNGKWLEL